MYVDCRYEVCFDELVIRMTQRFLLERIQELSVGVDAAEADLDVEGWRSQIYRHFLRSRGLQPCSARGWRLFRGESADYEPLSTVDTTA